MHDYLFLSTSLPSPMLQQRINLAVTEGYKPFLLFWKRNLFYPGEPSHEYTQVSYDMAGDGNFIRRLWKLRKFISWLRRMIKEQVKPGSICFCDSPDMLFSVLVAGRGHRLRIRYSLEDLHSLQLKKGIAGDMIRRVEANMLSKVEMLILTSQAFWDAYYAKFRVRDYVVVENVPAKSIWEGFTRIKSTDAFVIGFVGNIRYLDCLFALVKAVRVLVSKGSRIEIVFSGGGKDHEVKQLRDFCGDDPFITFTGSYNYGRDIKKLYEGIDLIYSVYDTRSVNVQLAMPNKFYEAIIARIPMLVSSGTYLEQRVLEAGIGTGVDFMDEEDMVKTIGSALLPDSWYSRARENLAVTDLDRYYYDSQTAAMRKAIL